VKLFELFHRKAGAILMLLFAESDCVLHSQCHKPFSAPRLLNLSESNGWHAFRRGLGTRLNEMRVNDKEIQNILRHADISTSQAFYILPNLERAKAGLKKLGVVAQKKYGITV
jgi:integrase